MNLALRIARRFYASYFNVGDTILWGKYKNHHGKIVAFSQDKWGNPTIEIEPIPKGRKQNKVMGLFKIWRADVKENAMKKLLEQQKSAAEDVDKHFLEVWSKSMDKQAEGLDLKDSEDRTTFRLNVLEATKNLRVQGLQTIAANLGAAKSSSRDSLVKTIANAYIAGKQIKQKTAGETMDITKRIVARYTKVAGIDVGRTYVSADDNVRIHRFRDHFKVWDLTNAGKKGKKVDGINLQTTYYYKGDAQAWLDNVGKHLPSQGSFDKIVSLIKDMQHDFPNEIEMTTFTERGIDVLPASSSPVQLETETGIHIKADPLDFSVVNSVTHTGPKGNSFKQDTLFSPRKKQDALLFYTWLKANLSKVNKMTMNELRDTWHSEGIQYDYH